MLTLVNEFDIFLSKRGMVPENYYKITDSKVAVCTPQLSDMMELKQVAPKESMVYIVDSSGEIKLGAYVTDQEKKEYYSQFKSKKGKRKGRKKGKKSKSKSDAKAEVKEDL